jgi:hypothetical protein
MPKATTSKETTRFELESCEGGYVVLRKMTYGETLKSRELAATFSGSRGRNEAEMSMGITASAMYMLQRSIVDHNLEDDEARLLNFNNKADVDKLDPAIAEEVENLIDDLNARKPVEELAPLAKVSGLPSTGAALETISKS